MYKIEFYEDKSGKSEIVNFLKELNQKAAVNKDSRINFNKIVAYYKDSKFIVLHHFIKKTQKTPKREIEQAKRNLQDYLERNRQI